MKTQIIPVLLLLGTLQEGVRAEIIPLISPPPPETQQPLPELQETRSCPSLQTAIQANLGSETRVWSVTVLNSDGDVLGDINGSVARIPASNQKLISTAYALARLGDLQLGHGHQLGARFEEKARLPERQCACASRAGGRAAR